MNKKLIFIMNQINRLTIVEFPSDYSETKEAL